jgi:hypothetical protein
MNPATKALLHHRAQPLAAADLPVKWLYQVRDVIKRDGHKLRAGFPACIEIKGPEAWQALQLPSNGIEFTGKRDRDQALAWLNGDHELPAMPVEVKS